MLVTSANPVAWKTAVSCVRTADSFLATNSILSPPLSKQTYALSEDTVGTGDITDNGAATGTNNGWGTSALRDGGGAAEDPRTPPSKSPRVSTDFCGALFIGVFEDNDGALVGTKGAIDANRPNVGASGVKEFSGGGEAPNISPIIFLAEKDAAC